MLNEKIIISNDISLLDALSIMDQTNRKLLIVCENRKFLGVISIGDIQRALLNKKDLKLPVSKFVREKITFVLEGKDINAIKEKMLEEKIESMPVVDSDGELKDIIEWDQLFISDKTEEEKKVDFPVVIMAGGKGTRLLPITNIIPKPLIPISDKTIMEEIMLQFKKFGCNKFIVSVNYMMDAIKDYFSQKPEWAISYIQEKEPLGTGGSLYLLKNSIKNTFFVTNCDTLIDINIQDLIDYHRKNNNMITVVTAVKKIHIPYGTIETVDNGVIKKIQEKPDYIYQVNTGLYVFEPIALKYIEDEKYINIPDLIKKMITVGEKIGAFPISEGSWNDVGNWDEYLHLVNRYENRG